MLEVAWTVATAMLLLAMLLTGWRLLRGPDAADRALALDTLYVNAVAILVLIGFEDHGRLTFEAAALIALMGFVGTVALGKFLLRGDVIE